MLAALPRIPQVALLFASEHVKILSREFLMKKIKIALLFGGRSGEHEVSIASASSIYHALNRKKYELTLIGIDKQGRWFFPDAKACFSSKNPMRVKLDGRGQEISWVPFEQKQQLVSLHSKKVSLSSFDVIFPVLHGSYGEDGTIQGLLELSHSAYVGCGVLGSALGMDKAISRQLFAASGIPVVDSFVITAQEFQKDPRAVLEHMCHCFSFPYFVKPVSMGSSLGVSKVKNLRHALRLFENAFLYDTKVLVEQAVNARELECSILGGNPPRASVVGEIIPKHEFYSYEAKYLDKKGASLKIPADLDPSLVKKIQNYALEAFSLIGGSGLARIDFFLDQDTQELFLNEVNTMPGFTEISMYPKLWEASGLSYSKLLDTLVDLAIQRHQEKSQLKISYS